MGGGGWAGGRWDGACELTPHPPPRCPLPLTNHTGLLLLPLLAGFNPNNALMDTSILVGFYFFLVGVALLVFYVRLPRQNVRWQTWFCVRR